MSKQKSKIIKRHVDITYFVNSDAAACVTIWRNKRYHVYEKVSAASMGRLSFHMAMNNVAISSHLGTHCTLWFGSDRKLGD